MRCPEVRDLIHPFLDGELEVEKNVQVLKHLELCPPCRARSEEETALRGRVVACCAERLDEAARARILAGAFARAEREPLSAEPVRAAGRRLVAVAAGLLLLLGGGALLTADPFCLRGCPTRALLEQARQVMRSEPLPLARVEEEFKRHIEVPTLLTTRLLGGNALRSCGGPCQPVLRFGCGEGQLCFFRIPNGHAHVGQRRQLPDGREYLVVDRDGVRFVGWVLPDGTLVGCMPCPRLPEEQVYTLASALRD